MLKKIWKFISSMRFAIALLALLAVACSVSSLIEQNQTYAWYARNYSERRAALIMALRLDDAFHSGWFIAIIAFLCLNLLLCNLLRLPRLVRRTRAEGRPEGALGQAGDVCAAGLGDPGAAFVRLHMPHPVACVTEDGRDALFASRNRAGLWGAWVCHLGILLLILGFGLGQMTQRQYTIDCVPGQSRPIGSTGYALGVDDFNIERYADGNPSQYVSDITVYDLSGGDDAGKSARISTNHPASLYGMRFYPYATGWAARADVYKDGQPLQQEIVCAGGLLPVADLPELVIYLKALYPDYPAGDGGVPVIDIDQATHPAYDYAVYYKAQMVGADVLTADETITVNNYTVAFSQPRRYTEILVKRDLFTPLALAGGLLALLGLVLALYVQPSKVWAIREPDGSWTLRGQSRKGGALFRERFERAVHS